MKHPTIILGLLLFFSMASFAQSNWNLEKDKEDIKVYTSIVQGSKLKAYKAITMINASVGQLVRTLQDPNQFVKWMPNCEVAKLYELKANVQIHYLELRAPFPVSNRDGYYRFTYQNMGENVKVDIEAMPDYGKKINNLIRISYSKGFWLLEKISPNQSRITYQVHADPGGSIPSWLANSAVVDTPFETLKNLKKYLKG